MASKMFALLALAAFAGAAIADPAKEAVADVAQGASADIKTADRHGNYGNYGKYHKHHHCYKKKIRHDKWCYKNCYDAKKYKHVCDYETKYYDHCYNEIKYKTHCSKGYHRHKHGHHGQKHGHHGNKHKDSHKSRMSVEDDGSNMETSAKTYYNRCYKKPYNSKKCDKVPYKEKKCYNKEVGTFKKCEKYYCPYYSYKKVCN